ncbi:hypothetical protein GCM10011344_32220 [Dokdonia pacifica]|uniref:Uncharacterized protein n=1 Tax=Dokdonia pacifica TaxID=1627892 RepID=A0A239BL14_9FLAO|nr:hypothetical protein [Dokdonia pacifica]GGG28931.1 hypothetical protein GCM10011344_32220 [Dokdonia pacifica]SNS08322.1 hypothetical protein SAMN06265376_106245 [Dokdonia pacifica]
MTPEEITRLQELKTAIHNCPEGFAMQLLGMPVLEEFLALSVKEKESN